MNVLYSFPHSIGGPGISTTAYHQVIGLVEQGIDVDVVCTCAARELPGVRNLTETLRLRRRIPHRALGVYRAYAYHDWRTARLIERRRGDFDLVHTWPAGCLRTLRQARAAGVTAFREVPSAHTRTAFEDAAREAEVVGVELPTNHHHRFDPDHLTRELLEFEAADRLLVPSAYVERTFIERGYPAERLIRHQYGFDPAAFALSTYLEEPRIEGLTAVFVGRGEPNKGLHIALDAWFASRASDNGRLLVCGDMMPTYRSRIAHQLTHPSVHELGFVHDVGKVMREAQVLLLPSLTEGSALVTYEAQAAGCALLVSEAAGAPCEHRVHGLIHAPGDVSTLTEHLRLVDRDRRLLDALRKRALAHATSLTWTVAGHRLVRAYQEGIERGARVLQNSGRNSYLEEVR